MKTIDTNINRVEHSFEKLKLRFARHNRYREHHCEDRTPPVQILVAVLGNMLRLGNRFR